MPLLTLTNLAHAHGTRHILTDVTLSIEADERIGLVGRNGTGKTTLLKCITGRIRPDSGVVSLSRGARVGYLTQDPEFDPEETLYGIAESAFAEVHRLHEEMNRLSHEMAEAQGDALDRLMKQYAKAEEQLTHLDGYALEHKVEETLHGLGFSTAQFTLPVRALSGGQKGRLALAKLLLEEPDLLLLDEPTNHLDIEGRLWLESFLAQEYHGAVLVVSHDRYLLNRAVNRILELEVTGTISTYPGNYDQFRALRAERKLTEQRVFEKQQERIASEQKFIDRYRAGQRARQAQGRLSRLERFIDNSMDKPIEMEVMNLQLPKAQRSGDIVLEAIDISKEYDHKPLFRDFSCTIKRGERIGIIGPNGAGKSTLVRCLLGETAVDKGKVKIGSALSIGYYRQSHEHLDLGKTVWEQLQSVILGYNGSMNASEQQARDLAGAFLFSGGDQDKSLGLLSGGERSRVVLAGLVAGGHNLLVLDEPTNHFDIPSSERLEQVLTMEEGGFGGTLILISHDRAFLDACVTRLLVLDGRGGVTDFAGNYAAWSKLQKERQAAGTSASKSAAKPAAPKAAAKPEPAPRMAGPSQPRPKPSGAITKLSQEKLEAQMEQLQRRITEIDARMADPQVLRDGRKVKELVDERGKRAEELAPLEEEWLRRSEEA